MNYTLKLGDKCNNNCAFCNIVGWNLQYRKKLNRIKQEILYAIRNGVDNFIICNGEPTIRKDFFTILDYIKKKKAKITIVTNGRIFNYKWFVKKVLNYTQSFSISLFGSIPTIHDNITRTPNSFKQTINGIKNILQLDNKVKINIMTIVTNSNKSDLLEIAKICSVLHITSLRVFIPRYLGKNSIFPEIKDIINELIDVYEYCTSKGIKLYLNGVNKNLRYMLNYYHYLAFGKPYYFRVDLHPIYGCNSSCIMCDNWKNKIKEGYSKEKLMSLIDELVDFGIKELRFHGQEPTLRKDLIELIEYAKKRGLIVGLKTNCNLIDRDYAKKLTSTGIDMVYVSIDSAIPKIHNIIRGNENSFNVNKKAIKYLKEFSNSKIKIFSNSVVTNINYEQLDKMLDLAKAWGVDKVSFVQLNTKNKKDISKLKLSKEQFQEFFFEVVPKILKKSIKYSIPVSFSPIFADLVNKPYKFMIRELKIDKSEFMKELDCYVNGNYGEIFYKNFGCYGPIDHATINPEGKVYSCCVMPRKPELSVGDIKNENFFDIWNKKDYKKIRVNSNFKCKFYHDCGSNLSSRKAINSFINSQRIITDFNNHSEYLDFLNKIFFMSESIIRFLQFRKIKDLLLFVYLNIPFYKRRLDRLNISPEDIETIDDFYMLPITTKSAIRKNFPHNLIFKDLKEEIIFESTSGSSFEKIDFARPRNSKRFLKKIFSYATTTDFKLNDLYAVFTTPHCSSEFCHTRSERIPDYVNEIILPTQVNIMNSSDRAVKERISILKKNKPKVLHSDPFYLKVLVSHAKKLGIKLPKLNMINSTYELLTKNTKRFLEKNFGCSVFDFYGCSEIGPIAFSCEKGNKHIFSDSVFVEIVPIEGAKDSEFGKIVVTDLDNYVMPLIRYETGDVGIIRKEKCSCKRNTPVIEVYGRLDECMKIKDKIITPKEFAEAIEEIEGIEFYQGIIKDKKRIEIRIVRNKKWKKGSEVKIKSVINNLFGKEMEVGIAFVKAIPNETSGKFKILKIAPELRIK
jgi:phenylacetate-CoA ligase